MGLVRTAVYAGTAAGILSLGVLMLAARAEGRRAVQPVNATSHWLHGSWAAWVRDVDVEHTAVGLATHQASALFWGAVFAAGRARGTTGSALGDGALMAAVAAAVDYGVVPRRLTPGWELVVSPGAVAAAYAALALGFALGAQAAPQRARRVIRSRGDRRGRRRLA